MPFEPLLNPTTGEKEYFTVEQGSSSAPVPKARFVEIDVKKAVKTFRIAVHPDKFSDPSDKEQADTATKRVIEAQHAIEKHVKKLFKHHNGFNKPLGAKLAANSQNANANSQNTRGSGIFGAGARSFFRSPAAMWS